MKRIEKLYDYCPDNCPFEDLTVDSTELYADEADYPIEIYRCLRCKNEGKCQMFLKANRVV